MGVALVDYAAGGIGGLWDGGGAGDYFSEGTFFGRRFGGGVFGWGGG